MKRISWLFFRLKAMSLLEILYRFSERLKKENYKRKYSNKKNIIQINDINIKNLEELDNSLEVFKLINLGKVNFNSCVEIYDNTIKLRNKINWHITSKGKEWSSKISSFDIAFKNKDEIGELRYTWELNRHLFFPNIALQFAYSNDKNLLLILKNHFYDWINKNLFLYGVNWMSPMEIAIRSYQWIITYLIIKNKIDRKFKEDIIKAIINSIEYVSNNFSRYSSANNHLIVEAAITSMIGYCLQPVYNQDWFEKGYKILQKQIPLQVYSDGIDKEQSTHYHSFVLDIMLQYNIFLKKINKKTLYEDVLFKMAEFIGYIYNNENVVEFGDSDDAKLIDLDGRKKNYYTYILQLASLYYKKELINTNTTIYPEVKFLMGGLLSGKNNYMVKHEYNSFKIYKNGGYCILNKNEHFLLFDVGELGFNNISAHGHADALSLVYYNNNHPIFIDSGTYVYNVEQEWRNYFRKTENHNTLYEENKSQSKIEGPFLWSHKAKSFLIDYGENKDIVYFKGKHDGYAPNIHQRSITYLKCENIIIIEDEFTANGALNYTIDPDVKVNKLNNHLVRLNNIYFYSSNKIEIVDKYISKSFLTKQKAKALRIINDFSSNKKVYCLLSKKIVKFNNGSIMLNEKYYEYINYKDIRGDCIENC